MFQKTVEGGVQASRSTTACTSSCARRTPRSSAAAMLRGGRHAHRRRCSPRSDRLRRRARSHVVRGLAAGLRELDARARLHGISASRSSRSPRAKQLADAQQFCTSSATRRTARPCATSSSGTSCAASSSSAPKRKKRGMTIACVGADAHVGHASTRSRRGVASTRRCAIRVDGGQGDGRRPWRTSPRSCGEDPGRGGRRGRRSRRTALFHVPSVARRRTKALPPPGRRETHDGVRFRASGSEVSDACATAMRVATKTTDFLDDQVLVRCVCAQGGLSEVPERASTSTRSTRTPSPAELGMFGLRPETLSDALAGKRCRRRCVRPGRTSAASTATPPRRTSRAGLQLMHALFTGERQRSMLVPEELEAVLRMQEQAIRNRSRGLRSALFHQTDPEASRTGGRSMTRAAETRRDVRKMRPASNACEHFNAAYADPSRVRRRARRRVRRRPRACRCCENVPGCIDAAVPKAHAETIGECWRRDDFANRSRPRRSRSRRGVGDARRSASPMVEPMAMASIIVPGEHPEPGLATPVSGERSSVDRRGRRVTLDG